MRSAPPRPVVYRCLFLIPLALVLVQVPWPVQAGEPDPLPEPLTLEVVLSAADADHPDLVLAESELDVADARRQQADVRYGTRLALTARARAVDPSPLAGRLGSDFTGHNDSEAELRLTRRLYDFGQTRNLMAAAEAGVAGQRHRLHAARLEKRLVLLASYLEVLLADLTVQYREESMVSAYVPFERARERRQLGQASDIEVLGLESEYRALRRIRDQAQVEQRNARARLAIELNRPGALVNSLVAPGFPGNDRAIPTLAEAEAEALARNPGLLALHAELQAAQNAVAAARAGGRPVITGSLAAHDYQRQGSGDDDFEAELALVMPLSTGGQVAADTALARAQQRAVAARLARAELEVRQQVFEVLQTLAMLQAQRQQVTVLSDFRDLYLDRSRTLYELEVKSDLGDAMAQFSEARLREAETEYQLALAWERLAVLTDNPDWNPLQEGAVHE